MKGLSFSDDEKQDTRKNEGSNYGSGGRELEGLEGGQDF